MVPLDLAGRPVNGNVLIAGTGHDSLFGGLGRNVVQWAIEDGLPFVLDVKGELDIAGSPGADTFQFYSATNVNGPFVLNPNFVLMPYITGYTTNMTTNGPVANAS